MLERQEPLAFVPPALTFGQMLRRYRLNRGLSQEHLAELAELSVEAVSTLERGRRQAPRTDTIVCLTRLGRPFWSGCRRRWDGAGCWWCSTTLSRWVRQRRISRRC